MAGKPEIAKGLGGKASEERSSRELEQTERLKVDVEYMQYVR